MNELRLISKEELSKSDLKTIINVINDSAGDVETGDKVITRAKGKPLAKRYADSKGYNTYVIELDRSVTGDEADSIIGGLYNVISFDFLAEITSDVDDGDEDYEEYIEEKDSVQHAKWLQEQLQEGWSYGMEFNEEEKRSPYLRPHHQLSENQKKIMEKSKKKLGRYGVYAPYVFGGTLYGSEESSGDSGE